MRLRKTTPTSRKEVDLTGLINVVFLILIFFIVAGALRPFSARDIELTKIAPDVGSTVAPGHLVAHANGTLTYRGATVVLDDLIDVVVPPTDPFSRQPFIIVADARLNARTLMAITRKLKSAGHYTVAVMSERVRKP